MSDPDRLRFHVVCRGCGVNYDHEITPADHNGHPNTWRPTQCGACGSRAVDVTVATTYACQCPHPCHYDNSIPNPKGGPGHPSSQGFEPAELFVMQLPGGSRVICTECIDECWGGVNLLDGASLRTVLANMGPSTVHNKE